MFNKFRIKHVFLDSTLIVQSQIILSVLILLPKTFSFNLKNMKSPTSVRICRIGVERRKYQSQEQNKGALLVAQICTVVQKCGTYWKSDKLDIGMMGNCSDYTGNNK